MLCPHIEQSQNVILHTMCFFCFFFSLSLSSLFQNFSLRIRHALILVYCNSVLLCLAWELETVYTMVNMFTSFFAVTRWWYVAHCSDKICDQEIYVSFWREDKHFVDYMLACNWSHIMIVKNLRFCCIFELDRCNPLFFYYHDLMDIQLLIVCCHVYCLQSLESFSSLLYLLGILYCLWLP